MTERLHFHFSLSCIGEGNGNSLQCSCLENPRDGEPDGLPSLGSHRVGHDWSDLAAAVAANGCGAKLCIFMVKWYFPKRILRRVALLYIFQSSLMSGLIEDSWISLSVHSICVICFGWNIWRKSGLTQISRWKRENYFHYLSRWYEISRLITVPNWTCDCFLECNYNVDRIWNHIN